MKKKSRFANNLPSGFKIQVTSMVDMFVILLVFLLVSYSSEPGSLAPSQKIDLPSSTAHTRPVDAVKITIGRDALWVGDVKVASLQNGLFSADTIDEGDTQLIKPLTEALNKESAKSREIASVNKEFEFEGKVLIQADKSLSYKTLRQVMYTSSASGFPQVKLMVAAKE